jgi:hypothetical protein
LALRPLVGLAREPLKGSAFIFARLLALAIPAVRADLAADDGGLNVVAYWPSAAGATALAPRPLAALPKGDTRRGKRRRGRH